MGGIEVFVILPVAALDLSIVPRRKDLNELMLNTELIKRLLKERRPHRFRAVHPVCELRAVVRLDALDRIRELPHTMPDELGGRIGIVLLEGFQISKPAVFVDERKLVIGSAVLCRVVYCLTNQAHFRDGFHIYLYPLAGISHLLVGLGDILRIWQLYRHLSSFPQEAI